MNKCLKFFLTMFDKHITIQNNNKLKTKFKNNIKNNIKFS